jgi:S-adenosylmethionine decarboxylase
MQGLHLTADLYQCRCDAAWLTDADLLGKWCVGAVQAVGLQTVNQLFHTFPATDRGPGGITATVLLAESHLCVHTWPEECAVTLDVYVCNFGGDHSDKARGLMLALVSHFQPERTAQRALERGAAA